MRQKMIVFLFAAAPLLAFGAPKVDEKALRVAMDDVLKDSQSARFRNIKQKPSEGDIWFICGEVNSKNSYGAYAGYTPFHGITIAFKGKKTDYIIRGASEDSGYVCEKLFE